MSPSSSALNFHNNLFLSSDYLKYIQMLQEFHCSVCSRFLFKNQVFKSTASYEQFNVLKDSVLCSWCKSAIKTGMCPLDYTHNNLDTGNVLAELKNLTLTQKRCISKLNTFSHY